MEITDKMVDAADSVLSRSRPGIPDDVIRMAIQAAIAAQPQTVAVWRGPDDKIPGWSACPCCGGSGHYGDAARRAINGEIPADMVPASFATAPAQGPITYHNDDAGFTEFLNSDQPYSVREIDGHCAILMDLQQAKVIGYRAYDHERANPVTLTYTNYRGETSERTILPKNIWFGSTEWHPEPQWLLTAFDLGKQTVRDFALKDFGKPTSAMEGNADA
ncbi:hypothetical protein [Agrobacterium vitis]|uniref:hypothetical protein n=1 Tax=Agrobacterium vitis TaxID=373 RepID=UPI0019506DC8|nr:hypothetical protein [Agrobacterium vitis]